MRLESLHTVLALATIRDLDITQFDVTSAYLHGTLKEEVYMEQQRATLLLERRIGYGALRKAFMGWYKPEERGTRG